VDTKFGKRPVGALQANEAHRSPVPLGVVEHQRHLKKKKLKSDQFETALKLLCTNTQTAE
jgi:hypothetical protein